MLTKTPTEYAALALACLAPAQSVDLFDFCRSTLMDDGARWELRRGELMRHWYRVVQARLTRRPCAEDPAAHRCEQLWMTTGVQIAKTTFLLDVLLYVAAHAPRQTGFYCSRDDAIQGIQDLRLEPRVLSTKAVSSRLPKGEQARDRALNRLIWTIGPTNILWKNGGVADDWRSNPMELILGDEIDKYPADVGGTKLGEGDPIDLGIGRQRKFARTKLFIGSSSPGVITGHAWARVCSGSHERPLVFCPHCGAVSWADADSIILDGGRKLAEVTADEILSARLARWVCPRGCISDSRAFARMMADARRRSLWAPGTWDITELKPRGTWIPHIDVDEHGALKRIHHPEGVIRSGWASSLYSVDENLDSFTAKMAAAEQGSQSKRKTFTNIERAEPFLITATDLGMAGLTPTIPALDQYVHGRVPRAVRYLVLFFDQQGNQWDSAWFPWVLRAFEPGGESWLVEAGTAKNHAERDQIESKSWLIGTQLHTPNVTFMDSANGNVQYDIFLWAAKGKGKRLLIRGDARVPDGVPWIEVIDSPNNRKRTPKPPGVREWRVHPWLWRNELWARITRTPGHTAWWRPQDAPAFYLNSLTSEEQVIEKRRTPGGNYRDVVVWRPRVIASTAGKDVLRTDNHWWDSEADLLAAASILGIEKTTAPQQPRRIITR